MTCTTNDHANFARRFRYCPMCGALLRTDKGPIPGALFIPEDSEPPTSPSTYTQGYVIRFGRSWYGWGRVEQPFSTYVRHNVYNSPHKELGKIRYAYEVICDAQENGLIGDIFTVRSVNAAAGQHFYNFEKLRNLGIIYAVGHARYGNPDCDSNDVLAFSLVPNHADIFRKLGAQMMRECDDTERQLRERMETVNKKRIATMAALDGVDY